jgi:hypothetical protein
MTYKALAMSDSCYYATAQPSLDQGGFGKGQNVHHCERGCPALQPLVETPSTRRGRLRNN